MLHTNTISRLFFLAAFLFLALVNSASADVQVAATITTDTTWTKDQGVYIANQDVTVQNGVTLTIEEGTVVKFQTNRRLIVDGALVLSGIDTEPAYITSIHDDSVGGDTNLNGTTTTSEPNTRRWGGITFRTGSTGTVSNATLQFAGFPNSQRGYEPAVYNQGGTVQVENSTLFNNGQYGIGQTAGTITIRDTIIDTQAIGAAIKQGDATFERTTFKQSNDFGLIVGGAGVLDINEVSFINSYQAAGFLLDQGRVFNRVNATATGGEYDGILLRGPVTSEITLPKSESISYYINGVGGSPIGATAALSFSNSSGLKIETTGTLKLAPGAVIKADAEAGIDVAGRLEAIGTKDEPVLFTAPQDSTAGTVRSGSVAPGKGGYIQVLPTGTAMFNNTKHFYSSGMYQGLNAAIINNGGIVSIVHSEIIHNEFAAIYHTSGQTSVEQSSLGDKANAGVFNDSTVPVIASNNYWADATGPYHPTTNASGTGSIISDNVVVAPWLTEFDFNPPPPPPPAGASSILFLPGIQASRLYQDGILGTEDQVWPPSNALFAEDVYDLSMSTSGVSEGAIYTRDIIDSTPGVGDVYVSFKTFLDELKTTRIIDDWEPYAYDWRYSVTDVAQNGTQYEEGHKSAVAEIERLSENSLSGKVTIVGHSNGGLLAKAIVRRLEAEGKANLIDKIIFLASPQLGTPKSIGTILHGYDQTDAYGGFVTNAFAARKVINNLPGAYGLLPSEKYFEGLDTPLVSFSDNVVTTSYRQTYGASISSYADYERFIRGEDGFDRDLNNPVSTPVRANSVMLSDALAMHNSELDDWIAPASVEAIEIVGTGLPTMKSVEYREIVEDKCLSAGPLQVCTPVAEIKPYAVLTKYGDSTVVQRSAEGYGGVKRKYFVNLAEVKRTFPTQKFEHHNITEVLPVQGLLVDIISSTTAENNQFISSSYTEFNDQYEVEMIDSPVRLLATDTAGNQTGVVVVDGVRMIKQEIPGSQYFEFGDTKYFVVPKGTNRVTRLYGEEYGGYTLTTAALSTDDIQIIQTVLPNASTSPSMLAEYSNEDGVFSTILTDSNGDGTVDFETTLDGELIEEEVIVSYATLIATVEALNLSKARKQTLLLIIKSAEHYGNKTPSKVLYRSLEDALLKSAQELIKLYSKKYYIKTVDANALLEMIEVLKNKQ